MVLSNYLLFLNTRQILGLLSVARILIGINNIDLESAIKG